MPSRMAEAAVRIITRQNGRRSSLRSVLPLRAAALLLRVNAYLMRWLRKKYKRLASKKKSRACSERVTAQYPPLFAPWASVPYSWWTG